jgi:hypothetical protein
VAGTATFGTALRHGQDGDGDGFTLTGAARTTTRLKPPWTTTANIGQKELTGSFTAENKTYDGNVSATITAAR